jgi:hypothetical protein
MEGHIDQQQAYLITVVNKAFWVNGYGGVSVGGNKLVLLTLPTQLRALQAMLYDDRVKRLRGKTFLSD